MSRPFRSVLLVLATLLAGFTAPANAEDPTVLVSASERGGLVKVTLIGRVAVVTDLVAPAAANSWLIPTQANGATVSYVTVTERASGIDQNVGVVNADNGTRTTYTRDGRSGHLLVSRDGKFRYILTTDSDGSLVSLVRTDARNKNRKTLLAGPTGRAALTNEVFLSGAGISPDGRWIYVARTAGDDPSTLYALNTATGAKRVISFGGSKYIRNVVASPDGKTLAVSFSNDDFTEAGAVALVGVNGGEIRRFTSVGELNASAFTPDGSGVILSSWGGISVSGQGLELGDVATGNVTPILGTDGLFQAVAVR